MVTEVRIKHMVCKRCIRVVQEELTQLGHELLSVELGVATIAGSLAAGEIEQIRKTLQQAGFDLIEDKSTQLVEQIKTLIVASVHHQAAIKPRHLNFSDYLAQETGLDYPYLSSLFSAQAQVTIEKYVILQKIERAKELLLYQELSLAEIAQNLGYSSVQYLANQFKKATGSTLAQFRNSGQRQPIEEVAQS